MLDDGPFLQSVKLDVGVYKSCLHIFERLLILAFIVQAFLLDCIMLL